MEKTLICQRQSPNGDRASSRDSKVMARDDEKRRQQHPSVQSANFRTESPDIVLRDAYVSAKDIAVEGSLSLSGAPPVNFATVLPGLYRSGYPEAADYPFMRTLKLKTIVTLVGKDLPDGYQQFVDSNSIKHEIFDMAGTKKAEIPIKTMQSIMAIVANRDNYPLLIHCNQGKHRTGCVVGVIRMINEWDTPSVIREYTKFAEPKVRETDVKYLTDFKLSALGNMLPKHSRVPFALRTFYGMVMLASFTLSVWVYSSSRLLILAA